MEYMWETRKKTQAEVMLSLLAANLSSEEELEEDLTNGIDPGGRHQRCIVYNSLLPYGSKIKEEADVQFAEIKANLSAAIALGEFRPGCVVWAARLAKFLRLYGLAFTREEHVALVHLMYAFITSDEIEPGLVNKYAHLLAALLKKRDLLTPGRDLVLNWRPLYKLLLRLAPWPSHKCRLLVPASTEMVLKVVIHHSRYYFPPPATAEMLEEWRPMLCPHSGTCFRAVELMEMFLPTHMPVELHHLGWKLWWDDVVGFLLMTCHNAPDWEGHVLQLLARLSSGATGHVDWRPYSSHLFGRFVRCLGLPVNYKKASGLPNGISVKGGRLGHLGIDIYFMATWIVNTLGCNDANRTQENLERLLNACETFFQPANTGQWTKRLLELLSRLSSIFVDRLYRERYRKKTWEVLPPESARLTEADIDAFVAALLPMALLAMHSRGGLGDASATLHNLALLRPKVVVTPLVDRLSQALDLLTEPHKLTVALQCMSAASRSLVSSDHSAFPSVIPLLVAALPGVDPNDVLKCTFTFQFIASVASLVPLVDCSAMSDQDGLSEEERLACQTTAIMEDLVLQLLERTFALVECSFMENTRLDTAYDAFSRRNSDENTLDVGITSTFITVLTQTSLPIFESALRKMKSFVSGRVLETRVAGKFTSNLCRAFARVRPEITLKSFMPHICCVITSLMSSDEALKEETADKELLFNLLLLSDLVRCPGNCLLPYIADLRQVFDRCFQMISTEALALTSKILRHLLKSLSTIYPLEYRSVPPVDGDQNPFDRQPGNGFNPLEDWGSAGDLHNLGMQWHVPTQEEMECVQSLVDDYIWAQVDLLSSFADGKDDQKGANLTRDELLKSLRILHEGFYGCGAAVPFWITEEKAVTMESKLPFEPLILKTTVDDFELKLKGRIFRKEMLDLLDRLQKRILLDRPDDTRSLFVVISLYKVVLCFRGTGQDEWDSRWKSFRMAQRLLENRLAARNGKKSGRHLRAVLVDRVLIQHEMRCAESLHGPVTPAYLNSMKNLFTLSTSYYSEVRAKAQSVLTSLYGEFPYSYRLILPDIVQTLRNQHVSHEELKGVLYMILGSRQTNFLTLRDWAALRLLWPALVSSPHSEKPSIAKLLERATECVLHHLDSFNIEMTISEECVTAAMKLWQSASVIPRPDRFIVTELEIQEGRKLMAKKSLLNKDDYDALIIELIQLLSSGCLKWRHYNLGTSLLCSLVRYDRPFSDEAVKFITNGLIHDSIIIRKTCIHTMVNVLRQQKRPHVKIVVSPSEIIQKYGSLEENDNKHCPGSHCGNKWLQYNASRVPKNQEEWDEPRFVHKTHIGFYNWPRDLEMYAPTSQQPELNRDLSSMTPTEQVVFSFFTDEERLKRFVSYLSLEEKKGRDRFNARRFHLFKGLFRNFGYAIVPLFLPHLHRLVADHQESSQRCASEILAGLIRGSKHWSFSDTTKLWDDISPVIKVALSNVSVETLSDWGTCYATASQHRDPHRIHWLLNILMDNPIREQDGSFLDASRLYMLQGALTQQEWKVEELLVQLGAYLQQYLSHPYQNVRERIASVLVNIYMHDLRDPKTGHNFSNGPHMELLLEEIRKQLESFLREYQRKSNEEEGYGESPKAVIDSSRSLELKDEEKANSIRLLKTVCKWISGILLRSNYGTFPQLVHFVPILCSTESGLSNTTNNKMHDELGRECSVAMALLAQTTTLPENFSASLAAAQEASQLPSWKARFASLEFLQVLVFHNLFVAMDQNEYVDSVMEIVLRAMEDKQVEVRDKAAEVLGGMLHCGFFGKEKYTLKLLDMFKRKSSKIWCPGRSRATVTPEQIIEHHAGILGLCAFVSSHPYDVPDFMPDVLLFLGKHLHDPQPVPSTIKRILSDFKRTHQDNWSTHKQKFTEDQQYALTDLLISPNYYA